MRWHYYIWNSFGYFFRRLNFHGIVISHYDSNDMKMINFMVDLWTNFAKTHDPTPKDHSWPATKSNSYVILKNSKIDTQPDAFRDSRVQFWRNLAKWTEKRVRFTFKMSKRNLDMIRYALKQLSFKINAFLHAIRYFYLGNKDLCYSDDVFALHTKFVKTVHWKEIIENDFGIVVQCLKNKCIKALCWTSVAAA